MASQQEVAAPSAPQARSRWRRVWITLGVLALLMVVLVLLGAGIAYFYVQTQKACPSFRMSLEMAQRDPQVIRALGEPIEYVSAYDSLLPPSGEESVAGDRGDATWDFNIKGPKGQAHVRSQGRCIGGLWSLTVLDVTPEGRSVIKPNLDVNAGGADEAPKWPPK